jgi:hypothetical protein
MKPAALWPWLPPFCDRFDGGPISVAYRPVHQRCLSTVQARIRALALPGLAASSVVVQKLPWARAFTDGRYAFPGVIVSPLGAETMPAEAGTNRRDDVGYPVHVSIVAADNQDLTSHLAMYLLWREKIARAFRNQPLQGVPEIIRCDVEPHRIVLPEEFIKGIFHSELLLRFVSREPRRHS